MTIPSYWPDCRCSSRTSSDIELFGAFTAETAFACFIEKRPDIVVLDLQMPGTSVTGFLRRLLDHDPKARILVFSTNDDPLLAAQLIDAGRQGVRQQVRGSGLRRHGMREVAAGKFYMSPGLAQKVATLRLAPQAQVSPKLTPARARHPQHAGRRQEHDRDRQRGEPLVQDHIGDLQSVARALRRADDRRTCAHCRASGRLLTGLCTGAPRERWTGIPGGVRPQG